MQIDLSEMSAALELFKRNSILQQKEIQFTLGIYKKQIKSAENELAAMTLDYQKLSKELQDSNHELHLKSRNLEKLERDYLIVAERLRHSKTGPVDQPDIVYQLHHKDHQLSNAKLLVQEYKEIIHERGQKIQKLEEESRNLKNHNEMLLKVIEKGQIDSDWSQEELNRLNLESIQLKDTINQLKMEAETLSDEKCELVSKLELLQQKMQLQAKYLLATEKRLEHAIRGDPEKGSRVLKELHALEFNTFSSERYHARQGQFSNFSATAFKPRLMDPNQILIGNEKSQILIPSLSAVL